MTKAERGGSCHGGSTLLLEPPGVCGDVGGRVGTLFPTRARHGTECCRFQLMMRSPCIIESVY